MTVTVATRDINTAVWQLMAEQYTIGISFHHTPNIGGLPGFTAGNPGAVVPFLGGSAGFSLSNPGVVEIGIGGAAGLTTANPGYVTPYFAGGVGFSNANPGAVSLVIGGSPAGTPANPVVTQDQNGAGFQGVIAITPGTPVTAGRSIGFICTASGNVTLTLADTSTITLPIVAAAALQTLPFAVTDLVLGSGTAGTFWNLK